MNKRLFKINSRTLRRLCALLTLVPMLVSCYSNHKDKSGRVCYGYIDKAGIMIIKPQFSFAENFSEGFACVGVEYDSGTIIYGYIDQAGRMVIAPQFSFADDFSEGLACVGVENDSGNTVYGYIDTAGKMIVEPQFDEAGSFSEGLAAVGKGKVLWDLNYFKRGRALSTRKYGYIDKTGNMIIALQFEAASSFSEGLAHVKTGPVPGGGSPGFIYDAYIDATGKTIIQPEFEHAEEFGPFIQGVAMITFSKEIRRDWYRTANDEWRSDRIAGYEYSYGYIDTTGKMIIEPKYYEADLFSNGFPGALISKEAHNNNEYKSRWEDTSDTLRNEANYFAYHFYHEGLTLAKNEERYGYIDKTGSIQIALQFDAAEDFSEGLACIGLKINSVMKFGYIDKTGEIIIKPQFYAAHDFSEGLARIGDSDIKYGYIDRTGNMIIKPQFRDAKNFSEGLAVVRYDADARYFFPRNLTILRSIWQANAFTKKRSN